MHSSPALIVRRTNVLDDEDRRTRPDGIVVASPPRTWFDCARDLDDETFEAVTEWMLDRHTSMPTLWATVRRLDAQHDKGQDRGLRPIGWQVERVTDQELAADFRAVIAELLELHALRSQQLAA